MQSKKQIIYPIFFMIAVTFVFVFVLATLNELTLPIIEKQQAQRTMNSMLYASGYKVEEDIVESTFNNHISDKLDIKDFEIYEINEDGKIKGYLIKMFGPGLWGSITGFLSVDITGDKILGIDFLSHSETPGLGGRISEEWFLEQFRNIEISKGSSPYIQYKPAQGSTLDAISGATLTSVAVRDIVNDSIENLLNSGVIK
jgi:Na+-transporting NADH:ubiquinone oxidoreductase subunit C